MSSPAVQIRSRVPRLAQSAVARARLTVVPRRRSRAPRVPFVTLVTLLLVGGVTGLLLFNTSLQQASFAATSLEDKAATLAAREQTLSMQLEDLRDPQRVAQKAVDLGMVLPSCPRFLDLDTGRVTGQACAPSRLRIRPLPPAKPAVLNPAPIIKPAPAEQGSSPDTKRGSRSRPDDRGRNDSRQRSR
ncbi:MAG: hypothetical protein R2731_02755 [Nocardioides sp.]